MSVSSVKTMVTTLSPKRLNERISSIPGVVAIDCSTGNVTKRSMSSAPDEGETVTICTWLLVMSGTASIGNLEREKSPQTIIPNVKTATINLF